MHHDSAAAVKLTAMSLKAQRNNHSHVKYTSVLCSVKVDNVIADIPVRADTPSYVQTYSRNHNLHAPKLHPSCTSRGLQAYMQKQEGGRGQGLQQCFMMTLYTYGQISCCCIYLRMTCA